ncbi:hypothetical protein MRX96_009036 [Rhipicephalus microplus]
MQLAEACRFSSYECGRPHLRRHLKWLLRRVERFEAAQAGASGARLLELKWRVLLVLEQTKLSSVTCATVAAVQRDWRNVWHKRGQGPAPRCRATYLLSPAAPLSLVALGAVLPRWSRDADVALKTAARGTDTDVATSSM